MAPVEYAQVLGWRWEAARSWLEGCGFVIESVRLTRVPDREWATHSSLRVVRVQEGKQGALRLLVVREAPGIH